VRGHLLVGGDDAVHVRRQATSARRPPGLEVQPEAGAGVRPLDLEVRGRRDDDQAATRVLGKVLHRRAEGEGRLAGARGRDRQEVGRVAGREPVERALLPGSETDLPCHGGRESWHAAPTAPDGARPPHAVRAPPGRRRGQDGRPWPSTRSTPNACRTHPSGWSGSPTSAPTTSSPWTCAPAG